MQNVVERVLNLLIFLLESPVPVTADDIRFTVHGYGDQSDDAFHRMFERDKQVLRDLGVPLERQALDSWEVDYGYKVDPEKYAIRDPGLTEEERVALSVAARMIRLGGTNAGLEGLLKLGGAERGVGLEPLGADLGAEAAVLGSLFQAVTQRRRIRFEYHGETRTLNPYGMGHRRGHWYVVGDTGEDQRVYRVDRMSSLEVEEAAGSFERPEGFDVKQAISNQPWEAGPGESVTATVRFDSEVSWWAARTLGIEGGEGVLEHEMPVSNRDAFIGWILSFGEHVEVLAPEDLRSEIRARVEAAMEGVR